MSDEPIVALPQRIEQLAKLNAKLERALAKLGTKADTTDFRNGLENDVKNGNALSKGIAREIKSYGGSGGVADDKKRLVNDCTREWKRYQQLNADINAKSGSIMRAMEKREGKSVSVSVSIGSESGVGIQSSLALDESTIEFVEYDVAEIENRHHRILELERDVLEVAEMFKDVQELVNAQQDGITTMGANIDSAKKRVADAEAQIREAERLQNAARKKKCIILFIFLGIIAVVVGVSVGVIKK